MGKKSGRLLPLIDDCDFEEQSSASSPPNWSPPIYYDKDSVEIDKGLYTSGKNSLSDFRN